VRKGGCGPVVEERDWPTGIKGLSLTCSYNGGTLWPVNKRPRTTSPAKSLKSEVVRLRVSADQKTALTDAAKREGLELSAWLRQLGLKAAGALPEAK